MGVATCEYPYCRFEFPEWNPVQEKCLELFTQDCNMVVGASVASGKTAIAEAVMGYELTYSNPLCIYVSPLKSIGLEKYRLWTRHPTFSCRKIVLADGDHRCEPGDMDSCELAITTVEFLHMATRREEPWLRRARVLVFDEAHLIGNDNRGAVSEAMLMDFTMFVPNARIVCLSGTMGNIHEMAGWLKTLNSKATRYVASSWRPTPLLKDIAVVSGLYDRLRYLGRECQQGRKTVVFVHSRKAGEIVQQHFRSRKVPCVLFHAGMSQERRENALRLFIGKVDILVATSSLGMGVSL